MITQIHRYCNSNFYSIGSYIIPPRRFALFYSGKDWIGGRMGAGTARFLLHYSRVGCALCNMYKKTVTLHKNQKTRLNYNFSDVIMWVKNLFYEKESIIMSEIMRISGEYHLTHDTTLDNVTVKGEGDTSVIVCDGYSLTVGKNVTVEGKVAIAVAATPGDKPLDASLTLQSGGWGDIYCAYHRGESAMQDKVSFTLDGAIVGRVFAFGSCKHTSPDAQVALMLKSGRVCSGIVGSAITDSALECVGRAEINFEGAEIVGDVRPTLFCNECGITWHVNVRAGSLGRLSELSGKGAAASQITFDSFDPEAEAEGEIEFKNPIRRGPDPWITYWEGYYYYTATMGAERLLVWKAPNLTDLHRTIPKTVYVPQDETDFKGLWSPELHYFSASDFGPEHEGWYLYLAGNRKNAEGNAMPVMFVMKSLDGKPDGQYGHPVTGEPNKYISIDSCADIDFTRIWAVGQTIVRINGKIYSLFVTEEGRKTPDFVQYINIAEMSNPYSFDAPHIIVAPTHEYEYHGHRYSAEQDKWWPKVVEGGTAIYYEDGGVYIAYSGSGYWTTHYCLAQIRYLGGDPLDINNYVKADEPFLVREKTLHERSINGCGHASYIRDFDGGRWLCYHAYIGKDTKSGRYSFLEPYGVDADGSIYVGEGTGHPAPIDSTYTLRVNPMPLCYKISGFDNYECTGKYPDPFICSDEVRLALA